MKGTHFHQHHKITGFEINIVPVIFLCTLVREGGYDSIVVFLHSLHLFPDAIDNPCQLIRLRRNRRLSEI